MRNRIVYDTFNVIDDFFVKFIKKQEVVEKATRKFFTQSKGLEVQSVL